MTDAPPPPPPDYDPIAEERLSGPLTLTGARLTSWSDGYARLDAEVKPEAINRQGFVHGGVHMILLDTVAGYAGTFCAYPGRYRRAVTLSLTTQFIGAVSGGALFAEARIVGGGRKIFFAEASVQTADGALLATASGAFRYVRNGGAPEGDPRSE